MTARAIAEVKSWEIMIFKQVLLTLMPFFSVTSPVELRQIIEGRLTRESFERWKPIYVIMAMEDVKYLYDRVGDFIPDSDVPVEKWVSWRSGGN